MRLHHRLQRPGLDVRHVAMVKTSRRPSPRGPADAGAAHLFSWRMIAEGHGILEGRAPRALAPRGLLSLHVVLDPEENRTVAWWETSEGIWLSGAAVGSA